jgi:Transaldolase/Fructose-6-phosphate aldolase
MAVLLDSASVDDAAAAAELGFVHGIATNPPLMARATKEPLAHLGRLLTAFPSGPICYQPTRTSYAEMNDEARAAAALAPERVVAKLPATLDAIKLAAALTNDGIRCALTAVYSPAQALLAHEVGCVWVVPYVRPGGQAFGRRVGRRRFAGGGPGAAAEQHAHPRRQPEERPAGGGVDTPRRARHHRSARGASRPPGAPSDRVGRAGVRGRLGVVGG